MTLDPATLAIVASIMTTIISGLLLFSWLQDRPNGALRLWTASFLVASLASASFLAGGEDMRSLGREFGNAFFLLGYSLSHVAARRFNGAPTPWIVPASGPIMWFIAIWGLDISFVPRVVLMSLLLGAYGFATAWELWRGPDQLKSQRAAAVVTVMAAIFMLARIVTGPGLMPRFDWARVADSTWLSMSSMATLIYVMVFGYLIMSMSKERTDQEHRRAALLDPLTGVANRRGFLAAADRLMADCARHGDPVAALVFDLDHFKSINDRFGHTIGDEILVEFCTAAVRELPAASLFGRMGGEEFAALLSGHEALTAIEFADRIRRRFAGASRLGDKGATPTVSIGVAVGAPEASVQALLTGADDALYRAKAAGRDRVVAADGSAGRATAFPRPATPVRRAHA